MRLDALYHKGSKELEDAGVPNARLDAWYLLETAAQVSRTDLYVHPEREIPAEEQRIYEDWITQRASRRPLQRILGEQEFMGLSFLVGEQVLIPRQDTEILVEEALKRIGTLGSPGWRILDMCTGTGCIALSLAALSCERQYKAVQDPAEPLQIVAADISEEAIAITTKNRMRLGLEPAEYASAPAAEEAAEEAVGSNTVQKGGVKVEICHSDLFAQVEGQFDMIVSNPPYIRPEVIETLEPEVRDHDPRLALDGGADGLVFYRAITEQAVSHLKPGGHLLYEIGHDQADAVAAILKQNGFETITIIPDLCGLNRVVTGTKLC